MLGIYASAFMTAARVREPAAAQADPPAGAAARRDAGEARRHAVTRSGRGARASGAPRPIRAEVGPGR